SGTPPHPTPRPTLRRAPPRRRAAAAPCPPAPSGPRAPTPPRAALRTPPGPARPPPPRAAPAAPRPRPPAPRPPRPTSAAPAARPRRGPLAVSPAAVPPAGCSRRSSCRSRGSPALSRTLEFLKALPQLAQRPVVPGQQCPQRLAPQRRDVLEAHPPVVPQLDHVPVRLVQPRQRRAEAGEFLRPRPLGFG